MLSDEEKKAVDELKKEINNPVEVPTDKFNTFILYNIESARTILNLIEKQSKEIEELKETLKCTQNSWYEDTIKIEEMKKQIDLDNECEIALNSKVMDLEKEIEELKKYKEGYKLLSYSLDNYTSKDKIKAKIEELENQKRQWIEDRDNKHKDSEIIYAIEVLQSLLEKE